MNYRESPRRKQLSMDVTHSLRFDHELYPHVIRCMRAHVRALGKLNIISQAEIAEIDRGLDTVCAELVSYQFSSDLTTPDIYTLVESLLKKHVDNPAIGLARARNDLSICCLTLWVVEKQEEIAGHLSELIAAQAKLALRYSTTRMAGMTHLQPTQAITLGHQLLAYAESFRSDLRFIKSIRPKYCPLGSGGMAGFITAVDRFFIARELGFDEPTSNSIESIAGRDSVLDHCYAITRISIHLSRVMEDLLIWMSPNFGYLKLPKELCGSSSLMPQKQNPDSVEFVRGKSRVIPSTLNSIIGTLNCLSFSYCSDLQEDKEPVFKSTSELLTALHLATSIFESLLVEESVISQGSRIKNLAAPALVEMLANSGIASFTKAYEVSKTISQIAVIDETDFETATRRFLSSSDLRVPEEIQASLSSDRLVELYSTYGSSNPEFVVEQAEILLNEIFGRRPK